jgi:outer membrane protein assembly factor BamB
MRLLPFLLLLCSQLPAAEIRHRFLAVDDGTLTLHHIDQNDTNRNWKVPFGGYCMDLQLIGADKVLLAVDDGYREFALADGKELKAFKGVLGGRTHSVERLPDGRTLLAIREHPGLGHGIIVLDAKDGVQAKLSFPEVGWLRHLRSTTRGTLIVAAAGWVLECGLDGKEVWRAKVPGNNFKAVELDDQRVLVSCGPGGRTLRTIDHTGKVLDTLDGKDLKEGSFVGFQRLANGNLMIANWLGHGSQHDWLGLFEYDATGTVVWKFGQAKSSFVEVLVLDGLDTTRLHAQQREGRLAPPGAGQVGQLPVPAKP